MGANVLACFPSGISKLSNCFPYCMGLHLLNGANGQPKQMIGASFFDLDGYFYEVNQTVG